MGDTIGQGSGRPFGQPALVNQAPTGLGPSGFDQAQWCFDMGAAPKDRPIVAWCREECRDPQCRYFTGEVTTLCLYHGHAEGMSAVGDGPAIIEWGGAWDDSTWEYPGGWMPDWWFRVSSEFEEAANPIAWMPIEAPAIAIEAGTDTTRSGVAEGESAGLKGIAQPFPPII